LESVNPLPDEKARSKYKKKQTVNDLKNSEYDKVSFYYFDKNNDEEKLIFGHYYKKERYILCKLLAEKDIKYTNNHWAFYLLFIENINLQFIKKSDQTFADEIFVSDKTIQKLKKDFIEIKILECIKSGKENYEACCYRFNRLIIEKIEENIIESTGNCFILTENFFKDNNIIYLESLKNGEKYIIFWQKLLLLCLKNNDIGLLRYSEKFPYTNKLLSKKTRTDIDTVNAALTVFQDLSMIEIFNNETIYIKNIKKG